MKQLATTHLLAGVERLVRGALEEDAAARDVTTQALISPGLRGSAKFLAKAEGVVAGLPVLAEVFRQVDPALSFTVLVSDASPFRSGDVLATVEGSIASVLHGERVALNFLQRLSGIATLTARYVAAVAGTGVEILDTRKTTPGLRDLEKYAVRTGGGRNHRMDLSDAILIKDNHVAALRAQGYSLAQIVEQARRHTPPGLVLELEVTTVAEAGEAIEAGVDWLMLDNMGLRDMRRAARLAKGRCRTEASGGITLARVRRVAETGVDYISVGALTHSAPAVDISLEWAP